MPRGNDVQRWRRDATNARIISGSNLSEPRSLGCPPPFGEDLVLLCGCSWLLLQAAGGGVLLLVVVLGCWLLLGVLGCWVLGGCWWLLVAVGWSTSIILRNTNIYYFKTAYGVIYRRKTRSSVVPGKDRVRSKELWSTRKEAHPCSVPFQTSINEGMKGMNVEQLRQGICIPCILGIEYNGSCSLMGNRAAAMEDAQSWV